MNPFRRQLLTRGVALAAAGRALPAWPQDASPAPAPLPAVGSALVLPEAELLGGGRFVPAQAEGRLTLVYWWASTCPFCAQQSPEMQKLYDAGRAHGLQMLAVSIDRKPDDALAYLRRKGYSFPSTWYAPGIARVMPRPEGLPVTIVRGRDGKVLQAEKGQMFAEDVAELKRWL